VIPDAYPDRRYQAKVVKLYPQVDRQKGTLRVEVQIEKPDEFLWPDMSARITFLEPLATPPDGGPAVLVPRAGVGDDGDTTFVWTVADGHVRRTPVVVGKDFGERVQVTSGLSGGEMVIIGNPQQLREGQPVKTASR